MPTRISAGVGDHPYFLTFFITMIPIAGKMTNYSLYLIVNSFYNKCILLQKKDIILSRHAQPLISGKSINQYTLYSLIFNLLRSVIK